jgi:hypothetical protein
VLVRFTHELGAWRAGVATFGLALLVGGCGGGMPLSKSELDAKANAICAAYTKKLDAVPAPRSIDDVPAYVVLVKPILERGVDQLASLKPPSELEPTYASWMSAQREAITQTDELRQAAERNDLVGVNRTIQALRARSRRGNALAAKLGAAVCARD